MIVLALRLLGIALFTLITTIGWCAAGCEELVPPPWFYRSNSVTADDVPITSLRQLFDVPDKAVELIVPCENDGTMTIVLKRYHDLGSSGSIFARGYEGSIAHEGITYAIFDNEFAKNVVFCTAQLTVVSVEQTFDQNLGTRQYTTDCPRSAISGDLAFFPSTDSFAVCTGSLYQNADGMHLESIAIYGRDFCGTSYAQFMHNVVAIFSALRKSEVKE